MGAPGWVYLLAVFRLIFCLVNGVIVVLEYPCKPCGCISSFLLLDLAYHFSFIPVCALQYLYYINQAIPLFMKEIFFVLLFSTISQSLLLLFGVFSLFESDLLSTSPLLVSVASATILILLLQCMLLYSIIIWMLYQGSKSPPPIQEDMEALNSLLEAYKVDYTLPSDEYIKNNEMQSPLSTKEVK